MNKPENSWTPDRGPWVASKNGRTIQSDDFNHDVCLEVTGDFWDEEDRVAYANNLAGQLNASVSNRILIEALEEILLQKRLATGHCSNLILAQSGMLCIERIHAVAKAALYEAKEVKK